MRGRVADGRLTRGTARGDEPLSVRVGLNAGEPIEEDGDLFGATVILASRIAAKAEGGEILVADTVRGLCSGKGFLFADRGEFVAKGFEEPVRVYEVRWRDCADLVVIAPGQRSGTARRADGVNIAYGDIWRRARRSYLCTVGAATSNSSERCRGSIRAYLICWLRGTSSCDTTAAASDYRTAG